MGSMNAYHPRTNEVGQFFIGRSRVSAQHRGKEIEMEVPAHKARHS